jgi:hypothetical protein
MISPQAKDTLKQPKARRGKGGFSLIPFRWSIPADILISYFWTSEL